MCTCMYIRASVCIEARVDVMGVIFGVYSKTLSGVSRKSSKKRYTLVVVVVDLPFPEIQINSYVRAIGLI